MRNNKRDFLILVLSPVSLVFHDDHRYPNRWCLKPPLQCLKIQYLKVEFGIVFDQDIENLNISLTGNIRSSLRSQT